MLHKFFEEGYWFEPKRYGFGSGLPIAWQGWVLLLSFIGIIIGGTALAAWLDPEVGPVVAVAVIIPLTIIFVTITNRRTRGGWRWRWGDRE